LKSHIKFHANFQAKFQCAKNSFSPIDFFHSYEKYGLVVKKARFQGKKGLKKAVTTERGFMDLYITFLYKK